ncbi:MAG: hypothetical protein KDE27_13095, partial [Planctomycetes bacterium]|nr:hypothetical protein [Planctomycetota bacterium]
PRTPTASLPRRSATARRPVDRPGRLMGTLAPAIAVAVGGCASAWFYMMEQNMVMAGIIGVTTLVGAATLRVMFK